jgi:secretion/DNA translocation related TadE-like protein
MNDEQGAVTVVMLATAVVLVGVLLALGAGAQLLIGRARAVTAADAAALAAAPVTFRPFGAGGSAREEAARLAAANGARLTSCRCDPDESWERRLVAVTVEVEVPLILFGDRTLRATSRAEFVPARLLGERGPLGELVDVD